MSDETTKVPIGLNLGVVGGECKRDLPAALAAVAEIGYAGIEPHTAYGGDAVESMGYSGTELRRMLDENGLQCCGMHLWTAALTGENLPRTIELNQILGNGFLIVAWDRRMGAVDTIMELADILNEVALQLRPLGMFTGYHAHGSDFRRFGDRTAWEILFSNTSDEVVMQLDIGNCAQGGGDPIAMLQTFPGRARTVHLKDYGGGPGAVIGEGEADWERVFHLLDTLHHPVWYVVEEGAPDGLGFDVPRRSLEALRRMGR